MRVKDLIDQLSGFNPDAPVYLMTLGMDGVCFEARECAPNGRCGEPYVELSTEDVPEEWLGEQIVRTLALSGDVPVVRSDALLGTNQTRESAK